MTFFWPKIISAYDKYITLRSKKFTIQISIINNIHKAHKTDFDIKGI